MSRDPIEQTFVFVDGWKPVFSPHSPRRGQKTMTNVWLSQDDVDAIEAVPGYSAVNTTQLTTTGFLRSISAAKGANGTYRRFIAGDEKVWRVAADGTVTAVKTLSDTTKKQTAMVAFKDFMLFFDGKNTPWKISLDGNDTVSNIGLTRPDVSSNTVAINTTTDGVVRGVVKYAIAKVTKDAAGLVTAESALSDPFPISTTSDEGTDEVIGFDAGSGAKIDVTVNNLATDTDYKLYRTLADREEFLFVETVTTSTRTLTYLDNIHDESLGSYPYLHGDVPPTTIDKAVVYLNRVWGANDTTLYYSDINEPESWWTAAEGNLINIHREDGDRITALAVAPDGLLIFKERHLYKLVGRSQEEFQIVDITVADQTSRSVGCPGISCLASAPEGVYFYWNRGIYLHSGGIIQYISGDIEDQFRSIVSFSPEYGIALGYQPKRRLLWVSLPLLDSVGLEEVPTSCFLFDTDRRRWVGTLASRGFRGFLALDDDDSPPKEKFWALSSSTGADDEGDIFVLDDGSQTFDGSNINAVWQSPPFFGKSPGTQKQFVWLDVEFVPKASGNITVRIYMDDDIASAARAVIDVDASQVQANYTIYKRRINIGRVGRSMTVDFASNADQPQWTVLSYTIAYHQFQSRASG